MRRGPGFTSDEAPRPAFATVTEMCTERARTHGERVAYRYLPDGEVEDRALTYAQLDLSARALAMQVRSHCKRGDRVLILTWDSIDFILAFLACQHAAAIAVPVYPPFPLHSELRLATLRSIAADCGAALVLSSSGELGEAIRERIPELSGLPWLSVDRCPASAASAFEPVSVSPEEVSFLQYTSGSTGSPKGVVVTHHAVMHNELLIAAQFGAPHEEVTVGWLPLYHDMGLIGYVLQTLYGALETVLMPPLAFVQRPVRWLCAITRYRAAYCGAPNFAYELCTRRISALEREGLDLSSWKLAFNGAEPVRAQTMDAFTAAFAPCGFRASAWYPCYGLAESTLLATGPEPGTGAHRLRVDPVRLGEGQLAPGGGEELVSSGRARLHRGLAIVDPRTCSRLEPGSIGEIWLTGPDVASRYWGEGSDTVFQARLCGEQGIHLRTGDLGGIYEGELFVTGRLKDLIVRDGRNHYPQDIEASAQASHGALRAGCCAAFAYEAGAVERVVLLAEVKADPGLDLGAVQRAIRAAVATAHGLALDDVVLLAPHAVPKTSSGKLKRSACRAAYEDGALERLMPLAPEHPDTAREQLERWLIEHLASTLALEPALVASDRPFAELGLGSVQAIELSELLQRRHGLVLSPTLAYEHPTIEALAAHVSEQLSRAGTEAGALSRS